VADQTLLNRVAVAGKITFDQDMVLGDGIDDTLDINGHIKSCGTSAIERYFCDQSKLIFDANVRPQATRLLLAISGPCPDRLLVMTG
jgi:hypothetical protein